MTTDKAACPVPRACGGTGATPDKHFRFDPGPHLFEVCDRCNYQLHNCHFCGDDLRHDGCNFDGTMHGCYLAGPDNTEGPT